MSDRIIGLCLVILLSGAVTACEPQALEMLTAPSPTVVAVVTREAAVAPAEGAEPLEEELLVAPTQDDATPESAPEATLPAPGTPTAPDDPAEQPAAGDEATAPRGGGLMLVPEEITEESEDPAYTVEARIPRLQDSSGQPREGFNQTVDAVINAELSNFKETVADFEPVDGLPTSISGFMSDYTSFLVDGGLVSVRLDLMPYFAGAAHPNQYAQVINYDVNQGRLLELSDLFQPDSNYLQVIADYALARLREREFHAPEWETGAEPVPENYRNWNLTREGLLITFDPYQVGPYAAGPQEVLIPYDVLEEALRPDTPITGIRAETAAPHESPWLVLTADQALWGLVPGDDTLIRLAGAPAPEGFPSRAAVSPDGRHIAYITAPDGELSNGLDLMLLSLPGGEPRRITPLTSERTTPSADAMQGDEALETVRALLEVPSLAWSPDGSRLAFMGAQDGRSSDLYAYSLTDDTITRLTDGPSHAIKPLWSPDGQYIVHSGVSGLGTGAGYGIEGVWAARADGSGNNLLYRPNTGDEIWRGWVAPDTLLVSSWNALYGDHNLRTVNLSTGDERVLWAAPFDHFAFDPEGHTILVALNEGHLTSPDAPPLPERGLYLTRPDAQDSVLLLPDDVTTLRWSADAGRFFARARGQTFAITPNGEVTSYEGLPDTMPIVAPGGQRIAWVTMPGADTPGVWVSEGDEALFQVAWWEATAVWSPSGDTLFLLGSHGAYVSRPPDFEPVRIGEGVSPGNIVWTGS